MTELEYIYSLVRKYAASYLGKKEIELSEACDFGDSYGFVFRVENKYDNVYWCVFKKTYKPFIFRPNQDLKKFIRRKIMQVKGEDHA